LIGPGLLSFALSLALLILADSPRFHSLRFPIFFLERPLDSLGAEAPPFFLLKSPTFRSLGLRDAFLSPKRVAFFLTLVG